MLDTLDLFAPDLIAAVQRSDPAEPDASQGEARAARTAARIQARRAKSEAHLAHVLTGVSHFDHVAISTWCMARADLDQIAAWLDAGRIDQLDLYVGEIFPSQYGDEYARTLEMAALYGCRVVVARNHSKVMLMANHADGYYLVTESSANVNTNPRIEQTTLTVSRELHAFYAEFFAGLKTIDRKAAQ